MYAQGITNTLTTLGGWRVSGEPDRSAVRREAHCVRFALVASTKEVARCGYWSPRSRAGTRKARQAHG